MNIVKISGYAEAYYSEATYEEQFFISEDFYKKIEDIIENMSVDVYELDGKHSVTPVDIEAIAFTEEELLKYTGSLENNIDLIYREIFFTHKDIKEDILSVKEYLKNLDTFTTKEITFRKSQLKRVNEFIESLKGDK